MAEVSSFGWGVNFCNGAEFRGSFNVFSIYVSVFILRTDLNSVAIYSKFGSLSNEVLYSITYEFYSAVL